MPKLKRTSNTFHPLCLNSTRLWTRLRRRYGGVDGSFADRAAAIALVSPLTAPLRSLERALHQKRIQNTIIELDPVFVLGHWRSGTTLLEELLGRDPQFGHVTLFQTLAPASFLVGQHTLKPLLALRAPQTRPMDNVRIKMDYPQEEEFAIAHQCDASFYAGWYFPRAMPELFRKYALMEGQSAGERAVWQANYLDILKKATIHSGGKRLVLKNPVNTGRIRAVLELFPNAKFIHIVRNPYDVYESTMHLHRSVLALTSLQHIDEAQIRDNVLSFYGRMMRAYLDQKDAVPPENLTEIRFEDLERSSLPVLKEAYDALALPGWEQARPRMERYLESRRNFQKNEYRMSEDDMQTVERHWRFALDAWGYARPDERAGQAVAAAT